MYWVKTVTAQLKSKNVIVQRFRRNVLLKRLKRAGIFETFVFELDLVVAVVQL